MKLSVSIMAHPVREAQVRKLVARLDRDVVIAWDGNDTPSRDPEQRWATGRAAWLEYDPDADWHMVLQDDARVAHDLIAGLEYGLRFVPPRTVVSPYWGSRPMPQRRRGTTVKRATEHGASWISETELMWGVAMVVPTDTIEHMVAWCNYKTGYNYDHRINLHYNRVLGYRAWFTWPSLVDHHNTPSLVGHAPRRNAQLWHRGSALDVNYEGPVVRLDGDPQVQTIEEAWNGHVRVG